MFTVENTSSAPWPPDELSCFKRCLHVLQRWSFPAHLGPVHLKLLNYVVQP